MTYFLVFKPFEKMLYIIHVQTSIISKISVFNVSNYFFQSYYPLLIFSSNSCRKKKTKPMLCCR